MQQRRRSPPHDFEQQLAAEKARLKAQLEKAPPGPERDVLIRKLSQIETASHINEWLSSLGLQPPSR